MAISPGLTKPLPISLGYSAMAAFENAQKENPRTTGAAVSAAADPRMSSTIRDAVTAVTTGDVEAARSHRIRNELLEPFDR